MKYASGDTFTHAFRPYWLAKQTHNRYLRHHVTISRTQHVQNSTMFPQFVNQMLVQTWFVCAIYIIIIRKVYQVLVNNFVQNP